MINEHDLNDWERLDPAPLYSLPRSTYIEWLGDVYFFDHLDGMYSYCVNIDTNKVEHIIAAATVTPFRKLNNAQE